MAGDTDDSRKTYRLRRKDAVEPSHTEAAQSPDPNDVRTVLRGNLSAANAKGLNEVSLPEKRRSRRRRDYVAVMIVGNLALALGTMISPIFGGAGLILFNVGLTWVMWFVMSDY